MIVRVTLAIDGEMDAVPRMHTFNWMSFSEEEGVNSARFCPARAAWIQTVLRAISPGNQIHDGSNQ